MGANRVGKLTATSVKAKTEPGRYGDGDGLALLVGKSGSRSWIVRVQKDGKRRDIGLGSESKVPLKLARERAALVRSQIEVGIDPVAERRKAAGIPTFRESAALVHAEHKRGWKNGKHQAQWMTTLETYAFPAFGDISVASVDAPAVRDALAAIWLTKPETARRLRQRICTVIDWAVGRGFRATSLAMPVIDKALPKQRAKAKHHPALPYAQLPAFMADLRSRESMGRLALEAAILTAARSGEIRLATWDELDLAAGLWTIPAERMKGRKGEEEQHTEPLSKAAIKLFERMKSHRRGDSDLVFPGTGRGKPLSDMTLAKAVRDMHEAELKAGRPGYLDPLQGKVATPHGMRSTFKDWASNETNFADAVSEMALSHKDQDKTRAAYRRTDFLEKRRMLMAAWADFCEGASGGNVVRLAR